MLCIFAKKLLHAMYICYEVIACYVYLLRSYYMLCIFAKKLLLAMYIC